MEQHVKKQLLTDTDDLIARLSSSDRKAAERAFKELRRRIRDAKKRIFAAANRENDCNALSYLVELLGESRDPEFFPFIKDQLQSDHPRVRFFAYNALLRLRTPKSLVMHYRCDLRKLVSAALMGRKKPGHRQAWQKRKISKE